MFQRVLGRFVDDNDPLDTPMRLVLLATIAIDISTVSIAITVQGTQLSAFARGFAGAFLLVAAVFWIAGPLALWYDAEVVSNNTNWSPRRKLYLIGVILPGYIRVSVIGYYLFNRWRAASDTLQSQSSDAG